MTDAFKLIGVGGLLVLIALAALSALLPAIGKVAETLDDIQPAQAQLAQTVYVPTIGELTMSNHARVKDEFYKTLGKQWSVSAIMDYMLLNCTPREFVCREHVLFVCRVGEEWIGLFASFEGKVITAFNANAEYWYKTIDTDNCIEYAH